MQITSRPTTTVVVAGRVRVSIGIASQIPDTKNTPQDLLASADAALYRAKAGGPAGLMRATVLAGGAILQGVPLHRLP
jgi:GGDEF domain-containing protein